MKTLAIVLALISLVGIAYVAKGMTTPCPYEDSPGPCFWDAHERGNLVGDSFIQLDPRER